jgi:hypothetical protein
MFYDSLRSTQHPAKQSYYVVHWQDDTELASFQNYLKEKCERINWKCCRGPQTVYSHVIPNTEVANYVRLVSNCTVPDPDKFSP